MQKNQSGQWQYFTCPCDGKKDYKVENNKDKTYDYYFYDYGTLPFY
jgi:hypothetical protein